MAQKIRFDYSHVLIFYGLCFNFSKAYPNLLGKKGYVFVVVVLIFQKHIVPFVSH